MSFFFVDARPGVPASAATAPPGFTPLQISNLAAWYDASDATTISQSAAGVTAWQDKSGNAVTLSQSVSSAMPQSGQPIDGLATIDFASSQFLASANAGFSKNVLNASTMFVVTNAAAVTTNGTVISSGVETSTSHPRWELRLYDGGVTHFDFNNTAAGRLTADSSYVGPTLWSAAGSAGAEYLRRDGLAVATNAGPNSIENGAYPLVVGGNLTSVGGVNYAFSGSVGEIVIFNRYLSAPESQTVEGYLACKWGLQSQLPASHPYHWTCPGAPTPAPTSVPTATPAPVPTPTPIASAGPASLLAEPFDAASSTANVWASFGGACLTAGGATTPKTSIPACARTPADTVGNGALQFTTNAGSQFGAVVTRVPLSTALGFQVVFNDAAFDASSSVGADGLSMFLTDTALAFPSPPPASGGYLGYVGLSSGYLGIGFDEYGDFSSSDENGGSANGFPGKIPETVAVRGAFVTGNAYLGGYTGTTGNAQSLPFSLDESASIARPNVTPTCSVTLTPAGFLTVQIDLHDGVGYRTVFNRTIVGIGGQPALPPQVYLGFAASTGGLAQVHQISGLTVTPLARPAMSFAPTQVSNLAAWYDASDPASIAQSSGAVSTWRDKSGNGNVLVQSAMAAMPKNGFAIDGLNALDFTGTQFLKTASASFSSNVFNASTTFVVTNARTTTVSGSLVTSGAPAGKPDPRYDLRLYDAGVTHFDFNTTTSGRLTSSDVYTGPAFWTAGGSTTSQYLRKNGNTLATSTGPNVTETGSYPLVVGGNLSAAKKLQYPFKGVVGEMLVYNRFLSTAETQSVEGYLACKWGLQNRLPANHPYRVTCPGALAAVPIPTPAPTGSAIPIVPELRSSNGQLALAVSAQPDASGNPKLTYNGSTVPPTLRLLPGDVLSLTLTNALPAMPPGSPYVNDTNLHFHGLHVSPNAPGDDSIDMLALPGQTLFYQFAIPYDHPPGLYWYHSHAHGEVERQNLSGMSGALIIDGIASYMPSVANMPERVLVVRDAPLPGQILPYADRKQIYAMGWAMAHSGTHSTGAMSMGAASAVRAKNSVASRNPYVTVDPKYRRFARHPFDANDGHCVGPESAAKALTINGVSQPSIGIRPGERQFWRLVNAGSDTYLDVAVDNAQMQIVALDGVPLASGVGTPQNLTVNDYVVPPASRVEFIVTGPPAGSTAYLRTLCFDAGSAGPAMPATTLAVIDPTSSLSGLARHRQRVATKMKAYHFPFRKPSVALNHHALARRSLFTNIPVARTQTLYYSDQNTINGQAYDPGAAPQFYAQSGTVEEWTIVNNSAQVHTFHIHQIHFLVEAIDGATQVQQFVRDNVNVPAATANGPGSVKLLLDFTDPSIVGTFLLHCHILAHEDAGMMAKIVVGTAPPLALNAASLTFSSPSAAAQSFTISGGKAPYAVSGCSGVANASINGTGGYVVPAGSGSCVFTVSDASGLVASLAIAVGNPTQLVVSPASLSFPSTSSPAQNVSVSGGVTPYAVSGCNGIANASVNGSQNGVIVAPVAVGACSLTITDAASNVVSLAVSINVPSSAAPLDNLTFHHDAGRTGWYANETALTTTTVASGKFRLLGTLAAPSGMPAFGKVYAQPLFVSNQSTSDGLTHNLVIVATATDQVYAMDETSGAVVWQANFTNPSAGIRQQLSSDTGCNDVNPNVGITGTPVIDRALGRMYVVVPTNENGAYHLRLHALSLASGADVVSPVEVAASVALATGGIATVNPEHNYNRAALLEADGNVYVPLGSHCDMQSASTHGWLLAFNASTLALTGNALDSTNADSGSNYFLGSIWQSGFGPAADAAGNVYFVTGNGPYDGRADFGMSAIRVPGNLDIAKASTFTPYGAAVDSASDKDLGSGGVVLLPPVNGPYPNLLVLGGKCGAGSATGGTAGCQKYVLSRDNLGGFTAGDAGAVWHASLGNADLFGGPATFQDANGTTYVVYGTGSPIATYALGLFPTSLVLQSSASVGCLECRDSGSQPIVSSNGTTPGTAIVWAIKDPNGAGGAMSLYAFDALNMSHVLFTGTAGSWTVGPGLSYVGGALVSPTVANGRVYVPTDGGVAVFGLGP